ncbi:hypothetical protein BC628DRAFT_686367 [Trametes gibbosa]|nr:hypothetical protein BC628DRAFT_686367 [Trametes gibbosa]
MRALAQINVEDSPTPGTNTIEAPIALAPNPVSYRPHLPAQHANISETRLAKPYMYLEVALQLPTRSPIRYTRSCDVPSQSLSTAEPRSDSGRQRMGPCRLAVAKREHRGYIELTKRSRLEALQQPSARIRHPLRQTGQRHTAVRVPACMGTNLEPECARRPCERHIHFRM